MTWLFALLASFAFLGTRRRPARVGVQLKAFILIVFSLSYAALHLHLL
jgi:hypothetical protein